MAFLVCEIIWQKGYRKRWRHRGRYLLLARQNMDMEMTQDKPREFSIRPQAGNKVYGKEIGTSWKSFELKEEDIHVIEYAAYQKVCAERDELEYKLNEVDSLIPKALMFEPLIRERDQLKAKLEVAREALGYYAKGEHRSCFCQDENLDAEEEIRHKHEWEIEDGDIARQTLEKIKE